jgi:hypothetical protein
LIEDLLDLLVGNLGIVYEDLVLLLTILGSIIFFAKDLRLGALILFIFLVSEYLIFSLLGMETFKALIAVLVAVVLLTLSLYITHSKTGTGII